MGIYSKMKLGMDVSFYQQTVNYKQLAAEGLDFVMARTGRGLTFDPKFAYHCQGSFDAGLPFFGYHVPDPTINQDPDMDRDKTCLNLFTILENKTYVGLVGDCEIYSYLAANGTKVIITNTNLSAYYLNFCNQVVKFLAGLKPFLCYSSVGIIDSWMPAFNNQIIKFDPMMAEYPYPLGNSDNVVALKNLDDLRANVIDKLETFYHNADGTPRGPLVPSTCKANKMIQFTGDHFTHPAVLGATGQVSACDFELFLGSDDDWDAYIHQQSTPTPAPEPIPTPIPEPDLAALQEELAKDEAEISEMKTDLSNAAADLTK